MSKILPTCLKIYRLTKGFPKEETYGPTSQIKRTAGSHVIQQRDTGERQLRNTLDLYMAYGSNGEIETQLLIYGDLGYIELK